MIDTMYNGRVIRSMLYSPTSETVDIREISYNGKQFKPENHMRLIHIWYPHFLEFHNHIFDTLNMYDEWQSPLVTTLTLRGGFAIPINGLNLMRLCGLRLDSYSRWFWPFDNGYTMCALFTQNKKVNDLVDHTNKSHYVGEATMDVQLYFIKTALVKDYF